VPPTNRALRVLICEDDLVDCEIVVHELERTAAIHHERVETRSGFERALQEPWDVVLSDYTMPSFSALEALTLLRQRSQDVPFVVVTGSIDEETAVDTLKKGADDYILKANLKRLWPAVQQSLELYRERRERRQLEEQLRRSQKMEAIGRLAAGIAHDFNNLLQVILGFGEIAMRSETPAERTTSLQQILDAGQRASHLTKQLLAFGKQQRGQPTAVAPAHAVVAIVEMLRRPLSGQVKFVIDVDCDGTVWIDQVLLEQALVNLVLNARDAMPNGGQVTIRGRATTVDAPMAAELGVAAGRFIHLTIADQGGGIAASDLPHVFEPFYTTKGNTGGSGLGLAVTLGIVTQAGGAIRVVPQSAPGTTFALWLPISAAAPAEAPPRPVAVRPITGRRILVVDDEEAVRLLIVRALRRHGSIVTEAANATAAEARLTANDDDTELVVCDLSMPGLSGLDLAQHMTRSRPQLPFLLTSGHTHSPERSDCPRAAFLAKPFTIAELVDRVADCLPATK
jgi:two-component system, cell cycle sensor histidine kinase and response regulator CckA